MLLILVQKPQNLGDSRVGEGSSEVREVDVYSTFREGELHLEHGPVAHTFICCMNRVP